MKVKVTKKQVNKLLDKFINKVLKDETNNICIECGKEKEEYRGVIL